MSCNNFENLAINIFGKSWNASFFEIEPTCLHTRVNNPALYCKLHFYALLADGVRTTRHLRVMAARAVCRWIGSISKDLTFNF